MITYATDKTYHELTQGEFVLADFYTTTCVPCKMFSRILEDLTVDFPFMDIVKVNVSDYPAIGMEEEILAVPTVIFFKGGKALLRVEGLMEEDEVIDHITELYYNN